MPRRNRFVRWMWKSLLVATGLLVVAGLAGWLTLRTSLPKLSGQERLVGLSAEARVERDANGVPTIHAANREDAARALGFLHAQERFFQMDLMRRQAAGELAELFGPAAVPLDTEVRRHRFRHRAAGTLAGLPAAELRLLDAYTAGVNAGLATLRARPWEYLVLRARPRPWVCEDVLFVGEAMTLALQEHDGTDERTRLAIRDTYNAEVLRFLHPEVAPASAALDGSTAPPPPLPGADAWIPHAPIGSSIANARTKDPVARPTSVVAWLRFTPQPDEVVGSNSFALAGRRVAGGSALVGNDMHLNLGVPNTWYRASIALPDRRATGVTLPGLPGIIVGSNGDVAWGFTDAYVDTSDVVVVERDPTDPGRYRVPDGGGWERFETAREVIQVAGHPPQTVEVVATRWGPLLTPPGDKRQALALRWAAHDPAAFNFQLADLTDAGNTEEAIAIAHRCGAPAQNFVVGDRAGDIAWTIIGRVPKRVGFDGRLPASWADGAHRWEGFLTPDEIPTIRNPPDGQLWTANNRVVGGEALDLLGDGGYDHPARAAQIRDRLAARADRPVTPADGLVVQLDDESRFLLRWRDLLLATLTDDALREDGTGRLRSLRDAVRAWHGHAAVEEAGHRLVRGFRQNVVAAVLNPVYDPVRRHAPELNLSRKHFKGGEEPVWALLEAWGAKQLPATVPLTGSREKTLLQAALATVEAIGGMSLEDYTWGQVNALRMQHPFSQLLPTALSGLLDMPRQPLPGDSFMPRVQGATFGASERMDVSPGHEAEGIFHQPGGASGHPLSSFYRAGHDDWAAGRATPFLPGPTRWTLTLQP